MRPHKHRHQSILRNGAGVAERIANRRLVWNQLEVDLVVSGRLELDKPEVGYMLRRVVESDADDCISANHRGLLLSFGRLVRQTGDTDWKICLGPQPVLVGKNDVAVQDYLECCGVRV